MKILLLVGASLALSLGASAAPAKTPKAALKLFLSSVKAGNRAGVAALVSKEGLRLINTRTSGLQDLQEPESDEKPTADTDFKALRGSLFLSPSQAKAQILDPKMPRFTMLLTGKAWVKDANRFVEMEAITPAAFAALAWKPKGDEFSATGKNGALYFVRFHKEDGYKLRVLCYCWEYPIYG